MPATEFSVSLRSNMVNWSSGRAEIKLLAMHRQLIIVFIEIVARSLNTQTTHGRGD